MAGILLLILASSCKKITENKIRKDKWTVHKINTPGNEGNLMHLLLPNFRDYPDESAYIIDFYEDGTAEARNYLRDSLIYAKEGYWDLKEKDLLYLDVDDHVEGEFEIHREKTKTYTLKSDDNYSKALDTELAIEVRVTRERDSAFKD
ncbi:MAG: hypothetical protein WD048_09820 [Chitinophagales bacterium]